MINRIFNRIQRSKPYVNIDRLRQFSRKFNLKPGHFLIPVVLAFLSSVFEGLSMGLLIPTVKGMMEGSYRFAYDLPILKDIVETWSHIFLDGSAPIFGLLLGIIFIAVILKNVLKYSSEIAILYQIRKFEHHMRELIFSRYLSFGKMYFDKNSPGHLQQILVTYVHDVAAQLHRTQIVLIELFNCIIYILIMLFISVRLTVVVLFIFPLLYFGLKHLINKIQASSLEFAKNYSFLGKKISNALSCIPLVKAYTAEDREKEWFSNVSNRVRLNQFSIDKKRQLVNPIQEVALLCFVMILVAFMAFMIVHEGSGEVAGYMVFILLLRKAANSVQAFNFLFANLAEVKGPLTEIQSIFYDKDKFFIKDGNVEFKGLNQVIEFRGLEFSYQERKQVIDGVSFKINKGEIVAIVGTSGSGKTTLINLLMRFYDVPKGMIFIDGVDICDYALSSFRAHISLVSQEVPLFNATLRTNLTYGLKYKLSDEEILDALGKAHLDSLLSKLAQGVDTEIGDRGVQLSGGEKQRLSIARAILKKSEILILDEATSSLDSQTERLIQEALDKVMKDRTNIIVAHRLSTIQHADKIIVLNEGKIIESGTLKELLDKKGKFYQLWENQKFY